MKHLLNRKTQRGFSLPELMFVLFFLLATAAAGGIVYVVIHFIAKF